MPFIEIPVEINTLVCVVKSNQHDGAWVEPALFNLTHIEGWGKTVFLTFSEAIKAAAKMNGKEDKQNAND